MLRVCGVGEGEEGAGVDGGGGGVGGLGVFRGGVLVEDVEEGLVVRGFWGAVERDGVDDEGGVGGAGECDVEVVGGVRGGEVAEVFRQSGSGS